MIKGWDTENGELPILDIHLQHLCWEKISILKVFQNVWAIPL